MTSKPSVERAKPVSLFAIVFLLLIVGAIAFIYQLLYKPGVYTLTSEPSGASVFIEAEPVCTATPCEFKPRTSLPKVLYFEHAGYHAVTVNLPVFGKGWEDMLGSAIVLDKVMSDADLEKTLAGCRAQRAEGSDASDLPPVPCYRVAPIMPRNAKQSGHCHVKFDVNANGRLSNVRAQGCTDQLFVAESLRTVRQWYYLPALENGKAVAHADMKTRLTYRLSDERGTVIPEASRYADDPDHKHNIARGR